MTASWYQNQIPSIGLKHPSSNHHHNWFCPRSPKTVSKLTVFLLGAQTAVSLQPRRQLISHQAAFPLWHWECLCQYKWNQNCSNQDGTNSWPEMDVMCPVCTCVPWCYAASSLSTQTFCTFYVLVPKHSATFCILVPKRFAHFMS